MVAIILIFVLAIVSYVSFQQRKLSREDTRILDEVYDADIRSEYKTKNIFSDRQRMNYIRKNYPEKWEQAKKNCEYSDEQDAIYKDKDRKEKISNRMFAYDYEEDLYKLYSKYAFVEHKQYTSAGKTLSRKKVCEHLMACRTLSEDEANVLIDNLIKHQVLYEFVGVSLGSMIDGRFYGSYWDVVSDRDLNLHKWMIQNGYKDPKENN